MVGGTLVKAWDRFWFNPTSPSPLCAFRIVLGLLALVNGLLLAPDLYTWFGPHGIASVDAIRAWEGGPRFSLLFMLPPTDSAVTTIFVLYMLSAAALMLGLCTRSSAALLFLCLLSFDHRNPVILNSGDTLLRLASLLLIFSPAGKMFSLDERIRRYRHRDQPVTDIKAEPWIQRLLQLQVAAIYCQAFFAKMGGSTWLNGTALYYTSRLLEFQKLPVPYLFDHLWTIKALTWGALLIELSLFTLIWFKKFRYPVLAAGALLHLGIDWSMNLPLFEYVMIGSYLLFIDPKDIENAILKFKLPPMPKAPPVPPGVQKVLLVALFILLVINAFTQFADFPLNGNPITWLKAHEDFNQGVKARKLFELDTAFRKFKEATVIYDHDPRFFAALGECQLRMKKFEDAEASLSQAVKLNPRDNKSWRLLSSAYALQNNEEQAVIAIRKALDVAPSDAASMAQLGLLLASQGQMKEAKEIFDQSRRLDRDDAECWNLTGRYYKLLGKKQETEAAFRQAETKDPTEPEYAEWLGMCLRSLNRDNEAEHYLSKATLLDKNNPEYWATLSETQTQQAHLKGAAESLKHAIALSPDQLDWRKNYGLILYQDHRFADAEKAFRESLKLEYDPLAADYYVQSLLYQNKFEPATAFLRAQIKNDTTHTDYNTWVCLGDALAYQKKTPEAVGAYKQALAYNMDADTKKLIEERIKSPPSAPEGSDNNSNSKSQPEASATNVAGPAK